MLSFVSGFSLGISLILAIGAQNAFVLRQGLRGEHVFAVCLFCALSDALLIAAGVTGFGAITARAPWLEPAMRYGGALFLLWYGLTRLRAAWGGSGGMAPADAPPQSLRTALLACFAFTWLNPHVYLDTLALIGAVSTQYPDRAAFGLGAAVSSFVFFFSLGYGARLLRPVFARPASWRVLDAGIGAVMLALSWKLLSGV